MRAALALLLAGCTAQAAPPVTTSGGGGGGASQTLSSPLWNPDTPEGTPADESDDFEDGTVDAQWTEIDNATTITTSEANGQLIITQATDANPQLGGLVQADTTDTYWSITIRVHALGGDTSFLACGIGVAEDLITNPTTAGIHHVAVGRSSGASEVGFSTWTDYDTFSTTQNELDAGPSAILRAFVDESGGTMYGMWSLTGEAFTWGEIASASVSSGDVASVGSFGLIMNNQDTGTDVRCVYEQFEYTTHADADWDTRQFAFGAEQALQ